MKMITAFFLLGCLVLTLTGCNTPENESDQTENAIVGVSDTLPSESPVPTSVELTREDLSSIHLSDGQELGICIEYKIIEESSNYCGYYIDGILGYRIEDDDHILPDDIQITITDTEFFNNHQTAVVRFEIICSDTETVVTDIVTINLYEVLELAVS